MGGRWELTMGAACPQWSWEREYGDSGTGSKWDGINYPANGMGSDGTGESILPTGWEVMEREEVSDDGMGSKVGTGGREDTISAIWDGNG